MRLSIFLLAAEIIVSLEKAGAAWVVAKIVTIDKGFGFLD